MAELTVPVFKPHPRDRSAGLIDGCGRRIDHLRMSVISTCDLRCIYCQPGEQSTQSNARTTLSDEHRLEFIRFLHDRYGLLHVRITGGEPLLYRGVVSLIAAIRRTFANMSIAMTTSGQHLYNKGFELRRAGLNRLNVSLDSLDPDRYRRITGGTLENVLTGLESARFVGFEPPKINTVVLRGVNDDEVVELARWALSRGSEIRFLEAMPIGPAAKTNRLAFVSAARIKGELARHFELTPLTREHGETARRYRAVGKECSGVIGLISPISDPFCGQCRRIRITAEGRLFPCLLDSQSVDLSTAWREGSFSHARAERLMQSAVSAKKPSGNRGQATAMVTLGG